jgi:RNA polymerase sigma factor (sigma-70 family)
MKGFARSVPQMMADIAGARWLREGTRTPDEAMSRGASVSPSPSRPRREAMFPEDVADRRQPTVPQTVGLRDEVRTLMARLDERERAVLLAHFGLSNDPSRPDHADLPAAYEQIAEQLGISTQRVRQIERRALDKLRAIANPTVQ